MSNVSDDMIFQAIEKMHNGIKSRNTITEQEFVRGEYSVLFNEELLRSTPEEKLYAISERFTARFSVFDPITVVDSGGQTIFELAPSAVSPNAWNPVCKDNLGHKYKIALEQSNPIIRKDLEIKEEMEHAIVDSTDAGKLAKWVMFKKDIECRYPNVFIKKHPEDQESETIADETNETPAKLSIDSSGMF